MLTPGSFPSLDTLLGQAVTAVIQAVTTPSLDTLLGSFSGFLSPEEVEDDAETSFPGTDGFLEDFFLE